MATCLRLLSFISWRWLLATAVLPLGPGGHTITTSWSQQFVIMAMPFSRVTWIRSFIASLSFIE